MVKPSEQLKAILEGRERKADDAVMSWLRFPVYQRAVSVLKLPFDQRREALDSVPDTWRGMVEVECVRVYKLQRGKV